MRLEAGEWAGNGWIGHQQEWAVVRQYCHGRKWGGNVRKWGGMGWYGRDWACGWKWVGMGGKRVDWAWPGTGTHREFAEMGQWNGLLRLETGGLGIARNGRCIRNVQKWGGRMG